MRRLQSPEAAKLLPDSFDFHPEADMEGLIGRLFGSTLGAVIPTVDQVQEVAETELSTLRYGMFVAKHKLDLPGTQKVPTRATAELARLRGASVESTSAALDAAERIMEKYLSRLIYPRPSNAEWERARVNLNQTIEWVKQEVAAFERTLKEQPTDGIQHIQWGAQSFEAMPSRIKAYNSLYDYKLRLQVVVYEVRLEREIVLEYFGNEVSLLNPSDGDLTGWLIQQMKSG